MPFDLVMTFHSTHQALRSEKLLKALAVSCDMIPTPRRISAGCGLSLELHSAEMERWLPCLREEKITWGGIYRHTEEGFEQLTIDN